MSAEVIVTGSRDWTDAARLNAALERLLGELGPFTLIHGGARGADALAGLWAMSRDLPVHTYPARWAEFGRAAGMMRNREMLDAHPTAVVLAFPLPQSRGTVGMMAEARRRGFRVEVEAP